jgi:trigger factor
MSDSKKSENPEVEENAATPEVEAPEEQADGEEEFKFSEDPAFEIDYQGDCAYEVKVSIPAVNEKEKAKEVLDQLQGEADIPGFRRGRAPRKLIEKKFSKAARGDATEKLVSASFQKLIKDEDLQPLDMPQTDGLEDTLERGEDEPITCTFKFEVAPRCTLGNYDGIEVERPVLKLKDKDIKEALNSNRERFAAYEPMSKSGKAKEGDQVVIDFKGTIDGVEFDGGAAEDYPYILGSGRFFKEFEEALQGAKIGAELETEVPFPEDYGSAEIAGKTATFAITVKELKRKKLPGLDDEFAKLAGAESLDELKENIRKQLSEGAAAQSKDIAERRAIDQIVEASTFELPKSLVDSSAKTYYDQEVQRLMSSRVPASEIEAQEEELRKKARETAVSGIQGYVVVNEIGKAEGIEITQEDFEKEAEAIQTRTGMDMEVISRYLQQEDQLDEYAGRIFRQKAAAAIMEKAKVTDVEVTEDELEEEDESADE